MRVSISLTSLNHQSCSRGREEGSNDSKQNMSNKIPGDQSSIREMKLVRSDFDTNTYTYSKTNIGLGEKV
jgi:hypothetical protein